MIPKVIHFCWFGGAQFNDLILKCMESWKKHLPDYEIKLWNEENSPMNHPFVKRMYKEKKWAFVSDYVRLFALYNEGGIYLDTDMEILKNLDKFLECQAFLGFEDDYHVSCGIIGAEKENQYIKKCLDYYENLKYPINIPQIITKVLKEMGLVETKEQIVKGVSLYLKDVFYPWGYNQKFEKSMISESSYALHHWQHGWKITKIDRIKRKIYKIFKF